MLRLINKSRGPADGWRYQDKDTGFTVKASSWSILVKKVKDHRVANQLPVDPRLEEDIEAYMCAEVPDSCGDGPEPEKASVGIAEVISLTQTLAESFFKGGKRVDQAEADRRAEICANCEFNVDASGCRPCHSKTVESLLHRLAGPNRTKHESFLKSCFHCGCFNSVQVWFPLEILQKNQREKVKKALPNNCWKK